MTREIDRLLDIMSRLRAEGGCPWDHKQTHESLRPYAVEEAFELVEAIDGGRPDEIKEELGDLLLQIVFHCQIASEEGRFTFEDAAGSICEKLVRRHPHVFGGDAATDEEEALRNWERIKSETEGKTKAKRHHGTPILHRALRLQERAVGLGFDWERTSQLLEKLDEEVREVRKAISSGTKEEIADEIGDLLFMAVNLARFLEIHPEDALERSLTKFGKRFSAMERKAEAAGRRLQDMTLDEMEELWQDAKKEEGKGQTRIETKTETGTKT